MPKNNSRLPIDQVNAGNFKVPKGEEHLYHVKIEVPQYDPSTGQKVSLPRIQAFGAKMFKSKLSTELKRVGYKLEILHDPTEFIEARKEEKKLTRGEQVRNKVMAELREAGLLKDPNHKSEEEIRAELMAELKEKGLLKEEKPAKQSRRSPKDEAPVPEEPTVGTGGTQEPEEETLD